ncbi:SDR family oxidoreductase [Salinadaptatus halalkaliphilus]|uniref:SDR family oxidoreductase n=1 Tax=Salinadaptatus halalkaliphilus TaxID=2419781 RepID=A0A4S3TP78_9EURY|nr:SDR family oxidoreductase [Salinadaptatus halalkaliphilus]THE66139.1 SDR family oxidoreductase [Salinadaptatus halalkaliphilus]
MDADADSVALVTGASAGIGRESAAQLAADGRNVVLVARREQRLEEIAAEIEREFDVDTLVVPADVSRPAEIEAAIDATIDAFGRLDVLVNNAGIGTDGTSGVDELPREQYRQVMDVNVDGTFVATQEALPHLRETNGTLIFVASFAGKYPRPAGPVYAATKWWVRGFALSLAGQVGEDGVGVSIINPAEVRTEFGTQYRDRTSKERYEPGEVTGPTAVGEAVAFAARQEPPNAVTELDLFRRDKFAGW